MVLMKRYANLLLRAKTESLIRPAVAKPTSFFRYYRSKCRPRISLFANPQALKCQRNFSSTTVTAHINETPDEAGVSAQISLEALKNIPVEDAARNFFNHCSLRNDIFDPHSELVTILEGLYDNPQTSERFVKTLQEMSEHCAPTYLEENTDDNLRVSKHIRPAKTHYDLVLKSWLSFNPPSVKRAQALLDYMEDNANIPYDTESCNQILEAWANKGNAERTQNFFDRMLRKRIQVDMFSFLCIFRAWSNSKSPLAVNRVETILSRMEYTTGMKPNAECYLRIIECWAKCKKKGSEARIEKLIDLLNRELSKDPDNNAANTIQQEATHNLLQVYHKIGNAHRAEEILLGFANNVDCPVPTIGMCLSVLSTWSKSASSRRAHRAEKLLRLMENDQRLPRPDTACYTAVLNCIASSKKPGSAKRAEALLRRMDENEVTKANMVSFTCVLIAWARSEDLDAPVQAERIYQEILDRGMEPDRYVFGGLIAAWGRSSDQDAIRKVEEYFHTIKRLENSKPTVVEYTAVIQAYANYVSKNINKSRDSVERAEALLSEMLNSEDPNLRPNILSYVAILKTIAAALRIPGRGERAERVVQKMVSNDVEITPYIMNLLSRCNGRSPAQKTDPDGG